MILPNALPALAMISGKAAEPCAGSAAGGGLVDLHGERLAGVPQGVSGSDEERVAAAGGRDAGDGGRAVAVVGEGDPGRQGPGLGQRRGGESAGGDGEGSRISGGEGCRSVAGDRGCLVQDYRECLRDRALVVLG